MATLSHTDSGRLYSWWWDSHIPKNSKWLQDNLTEMDAKVKQMIKLIEEDADSFARRAEMYYKKRPELMKLVEEFYRAYRALSERYDHATFELRQAHRTISQAFPNQVAYILDDDIPYSSSGPDTEPHTPDAPDRYHGLRDSVELHNNHAVTKDGRKWTSRRCLKQFQKTIESGEEVLNGHSASDVDAEMEVQTLKNTLAKIQAEKEAVLSQYTETLEKLLDQEKELHSAKNNTRGLDEQASRAETEIKALKEALEKLKNERDVALNKYSQCMERVSFLENMISALQMDAKGLHERGAKTEIEARDLKEELSEMKAKKETTLLKYNQCLDKISALENRILFAEKDAGVLKGHIERAESEVTELKQVVSRLTNEKEVVALQYKKCLERIAELEAEISCAHEEAKQLRREMQTNVAKLISAEEQCLSLEASNHSLQEEAEKLAHKIEYKDQELSKKQEELEKLQGLLQDEHSRFIKAEATLHNLQRLHSQSQKSQIALALELKEVLQVLKDLEACKHNLEEEMQCVKDENQSLTEQNLSSTFSLNNLHNEISNLKALKERLEQELAVQAERTNALQQEISRLKEEIESLTMRYQNLIQQVELAGLIPECLASSVKELQDEKIQLKDLCEKGINEREVLAEKLKNMDKVMEKNTLMESSLSELKNMLQGSREKIKDLQESYQMLQGEKSNIVCEKATLLSQLNILTEVMQKLLEQNTVLEKSLSGANIELEGLRTKSQNLEEYCQLLTDEKSGLLTERSILVSQLDSVEQRLRSLEKRFTKLEEKYDGLDEEKKTTLCQVEELRGSLRVEKEVHASYIQSTEARMAGLENITQILHKENRSRRNKEDQELDETVNAQVEIFILQKFIRDLEEKNSTLLVECQKHIKNSKRSDKLISELEDENLEQQVEAEFLLDEIEKLRMGIQQVFTALEIDQVTLQENFLADEMPLPYILTNIEDLKSSLLKCKDEKYQLLVENEQLRLDGADLESEKRVLEKELKMMTEQQEILQKDKHHLMDTSSQLRSDVNRGGQQEAALKNEIEKLHVKLMNLQESYLELQDESCKKLEENGSLVKKLANVNQEKCALEEEISDIFQQALSLSNLSIVLEIFSTEKAAELKALAQDHCSLQTINKDLRYELRNLEEKMKMKEAENLYLKNSVESFDKQLHEISDINGQLNIQITVAEDFARQKEIVLSEAKQKLDTTQQLNFKLIREVEELKRQYEESKAVKDDLEKLNLATSKDNCIKSEEIECLRGQNETLESEAGRLGNQIERHRLREENLCLELKEKCNELVLWDAEATSFYFESQISSIRELLLENTLYELNGMYENLKDVNCNRSVEIEQMKGRITLLESEIGGMRDQIYAYNSGIDSLREDVTLLEKNAVNLTKLQLAGNHNQQDAESTAPGHRLQVLEDQSVLPDRVSDLLQLQAKIKSVEKLMVNEMARVCKDGNGNSPIKQRATVEKSEELQSLGSAYQDVHQEEKGRNRVPGNIKMQKAKPELLEVRNGILMKDIPLDQVSHSSFHSVSRRRHGRVDDQMLQLWETVEQDHMVDKARDRESVPMKGNHPYRPRESRHKSRVPSLEMQIEKELSVDKLELSSDARELKQEGKRKILERLASDAQKITSLQIAVKELRTKMDMLKWGKNAKTVEYETVRTRLQEVEEAAVRLTNINDELTKNLDGSPFSCDGRTPKDFESVDRRRAIEQARKESEKIGQLQFDIRNIQYILLKVEDENNSKGNNKVSESTTGILLKDFIYDGKTGSRRRRKKVRFCGCMRSSSTKKD